MQDVGRVMNNRESISNAIKKLDTIEKELVETETRMEEVAKSRDIISRAEMRLQNLVQEADNLIKLFATVNTTATKSAAVESSALPVNVRDQVIQLAHRGWKPEQIAAALKRSVTEVELILEIPQKM
jgi:DNA-directed RNA polymerase specialized sigma24 family protein